MLDGRIIAINYLTSFRFWVDILSTVPLEIVFQSIVTHDIEVILSMFGMLKLFRAGRISTIIARMKYNPEVKAFYKLMQMIFFLILCLHIQGCLLFFFARSESVWIPPVDYVLGGT